MNALADCNLDTAYKAANAYAKKRGGDPSEYLSAAYMGLVSAAQSFDPKRNDSFDGFAFTHCYGAIVDQSRSERGRMRYGKADRRMHMSKKRSLDMVVAHRGRDNEPVTLGDTIAAKSEPNPVDEADAVQAIIRKRVLGRPERMALALVADGFTQDDASVAVGYSQSWLHHKLKGDGYKLRNKRKAGC